MAARSLLHTAARLTSGSEAMTPSTSGTWGCSQPSRATAMAMGRDGSVCAVRVADAQKLWTPAGVYCNTASYGLPPRPAWDALQTALAEWQGGRTSWEHWGESTETARAAFARLVGVDAARVAVGATVSELVGSIVTALPAGTRGGGAESEISSNPFPYRAQGGLAARTVPVAAVADAVAEGAGAVAFSAVQMS